MDVSNILLVSKGMTVINARRPTTEIAVVMIVRHSIGNSLNSNWSVKSSPIVVLGKFVFIL